MKLTEYFHTLKNQKLTDSQKVSLYHTIQLTTTPKSLNYKVVFYSKVAISAMLSLICIVWIQQRYNTSLLQGPTTSVSSVSAADVGQIISSVGWFQLIGKDGSHQQPKNKTSIENGDILKLDSGTNLQISINTHVKGTIIGPAELTIIRTPDQHYTIQLRKAAHLEMISEDISQNNNLTIVNDDIAVTSSSRHLHLSMVAHEGKKELINKGDSLIVHKMNNEQITQTKELLTNQKSNLDDQLIVYDIKGQSILLANDTPLPLTDTTPNSIATSDTPVEVDTSLLAARKKLITYVINQSDKKIWPIYTKPKLIEEYLWSPDIVPSVLLENTAPTSDLSTTWATPTKTTSALATVANTNSTIINDKKVIDDSVIHNIRILLDVDTMTSLLEQLQTTYTTSNRDLYGAHIVGMSEKIYEIHNLLGIPYNKSSDIATLQEDLHALTRLLRSNYQLPKDIIQSLRKMEIWLIDTITAGRWSAIQVIWSQENVKQENTDSTTDTGHSS